MKERNDSMVSTEKKLCQLFLNEETSSMCEASLDFPLLHLHMGNDCLRRLTFWQYLQGVSFRTSGLSLGDGQPSHPGGKGRDAVTGNGECSFRNYSLSTVEKLFDLLTHFIGIGKTT